MRQIDTEASPVWSGHSDNLCSAKYLIILLGLLTDNVTFCRRSRFCFSETSPILFWMLTSDSVFAYIMSSPAMAMIRVAQMVALYNKTIKLHCQWHSKLGSQLSQEGEGQDSGCCDCIRWANRKLDRFSESSDRCHTELSFKINFQWLCCMINELLFESYHGYRKDSTSTGAIKYYQHKVCIFHSWWLCVTQFNCSLMLVTDSRGASHWLLLCGHSTTAGTTTLSTNTAVAVVSDIENSHQLTMSIISGHNTLL